MSNSKVKRHVVNDRVEVSRDTVNERDYLMNKRYSAFRDLLRSIHNTLKTDGEL